MSATWPPTASQATLPRDDSDGISYRMSRPPSEADLPNPRFWVDIADNVGLTPAERGAIVAAFADEAMGGMFHWYLYQNDGYGRAGGAAFRRFAFARHYDGGVRFELYCRVRF